MAKFELAIRGLLEEEGGDIITNDPSDAGGLTHWGVTWADFKEHGADLDGDGDIDTNDLRVMKEGQAEDFYNKNYWDEMHLDDMKSQAVATKVLSNGVNLGTGAIGKLLQRAVGVTVDGQIGNHTIAAANAFGDVELMDKLVAAQTDYYWTITIGNINKKGPLTKSQGGLGWTTDWIVRASAACAKRDTTTLKIIENEIYVAAKAGKPVIPGNIRFIRGWLNRATLRYGI